MKTKFKLYLLLIVICLIYIGTGGSNAAIGSAWPAISADIGVHISWQGINIMMMYAAASIGAMSVQYLIARFRIWLPAVCGMVVLAVGVMVFSHLNSFPAILACGAVIGYCIGLEAPIINGYIAKHYPTAAITWLHCCYGIGSTIAPAIIAFFITTRDSWRMGFQTMGVVVFFIVAALLISIPLWRIHGPVFPGRRSRSEGAIDLKKGMATITLRELFRLPGGKSIPINMFVYCSFEVTIFFWATSFLTEEKGMTPGVAAGMMTFFFGAQVVGRIAGGFLTTKFSDRQIIRVGLFVSLAGSIAFLFIPDSMIPFIFVLIGLATGPVFPLYIHEVPSLVGEEAAQAVIGLQLASANIGNATIPLLVGIISGAIGFKVFPASLLVLIVVSTILKTAQDRRVQTIEASGNDAKSSP